MRFSAAVSRFLGRNRLVPRGLPATGLIMAGHAARLPSPDAGTARNLLLSSIRWAAVSNGAYRNAFRWCFRILPPVALGTRPSAVRASRPLTDKREPRLAMLPIIEPHRSSYEHRSTTLAFCRGRRSRHSRIWCEPCEGRRHHQDWHTPFAVRHDGDQRNHPERPDADGGRRRNAKGGLLGKQIEPVVVDPASNWPLFAEKARELLVKDKVAAVFGCWTSVSRKSVLPVFEELNGLLFYPLEYEGEEAPTMFSTAVPCPITRRSRPSNI